jgi:hypothetical protein
MATDAEMVTALQSALSRGAGVVQVTVDGVTTQFDREQARKELAWYERRVARAAKTRPISSSIRLGGF